jgi:predicted RND superfamily exporter protein
MDVDGGRVALFIGWIVRRRARVIAAYAVLVPLAVLLAMRVPSRSAIDRLMVDTDPDWRATRAFQAVFPEADHALLLAESPDPFAPAALAAVARLEDALGAVPGVAPYSALGIWRQTHGGGPPSAADAGAVRRFATGTDLFSRQGLVGDRFLAVALAIPARDPAGRDAALARVEDAIAASGILRDPAIARLRRVGGPYVEGWLEHETGRATLRYMPLFGAFLVAVTLFLYRSWRSLLAIVISLGATVALGVGFGQPAGFSFTIVSSLVPVTILVTAMATLVYLHTRFIDQPAGVPLEVHRRRAFSNKFLPVTASIVAAVLGFAALAVSKIQPIRELGLWTAAGLALAWVVSFTLFPALQSALATPTRLGRPVAGRLYARISAALPGFTYRWRWALVALTLVLSAAGVVALFGVPGRVPPMRLGVNSLDYVDPGSTVHDDMTFFDRHGGDLAVVRVWVRTPPGAVTDPELLRGLEAYSRSLEQDPLVSSAVGPTTLLRFRRWISGQGDRLPEDPEGFAAAAADLEQLLLAEPQLRAFVDVGTLSQATLTVLVKNGENATIEAVRDSVARRWREAQARYPGLAGSEVSLVGESVLQAKIGAHLVPTLTESFGLTAVLIFVTFLFVFRSAAARLMAMIPSVFAILAMFLAMRLIGIPLNVATILIATTVLGTTENDQIHFFHHFGEARREGAGVEAALRHAFGVSGHAILFATFINAAGFLALALSNLPPMRQFGIVTALAFLLAMVADFTALPAALWIVTGERPGEPATGESPAA